MPEMNRRDFVALAALSVCACTLCDEAAFAEAPVAFDAGPVTDYATDGIFDKFAKPQKFILIRKGTTLTALCAVCSHKSCTLKPKEDKLRCPCHGSTFTLEGDVTKGPAKSGLGRYKLTIDAQNHVIVDLSRKLDHGSAEGVVEVK